jgi:Na+/proline symporter
MTITLHWLDWLMIALYLALIVTVGLVVARRVKVTEDYFLGRRSFGWWLILGQSFGVGTQAEMPVSLTGAVYHTGYSAIWYQWKNLFITPFYWLLGPIFRRFRRTTIGEVYEDRYGAFMGAVYTAFALAYIVFNMGTMLKGAAKLVSVASGESISPNSVVLVTTAAFVLYSFFGGRIAAAYTDFVQGFFIILLSFLLIPLGLASIGGFAGIRDTLDSGMLSLVTPGDIGVFTILMLTLNGLVGIMAQPQMLAAIGTGRDEFSCRVGMAYGNFLKRFCTIGWALVGLIVAVMLARSGGSLADPEEAFGYATKELLFPGGIGLMIAAVLATNMSTCSALTVDGGALFTQNLYRRYFFRAERDSHYLLVGRLAGTIVTGLGVLVGLYVQVVLEGFLLTETVSAFMGISLLGAIVWKRANRHGALASLIVSSGLFFYLTMRDFGTLLSWDAANFGIALLAGCVVLVVISLATEAEPEALLKPFYERLNTRSGYDEATREEQVVGGRGHDLLVVNLFDLGFGKGWRAFYERFRVDINGLLLAFGVVAALIVLAEVILYLP